MQLNETPRIDVGVAEAEKQAAYTLLNRLVLLRLMEAADLHAPAVVTGGWEARGYKDFRALAPALTGDETEGYAFLLRLVFEDLEMDETWFVYACSFKGSRAGETTNLMLVPRGTEFVS